MGLGPGGLFGRECDWATDGLRERFPGVDGNGPVGVVLMGVIGRCVLPLGVIGLGAP